MLALMIEAAPMKASTLSLVPFLQPGRGRAVPIRIEAGRLFMKATPSLEGGRRVVYFEASKETRDFQGERVLTKALAESIPYFLAHGRIDLDHGSVTGSVRGRSVNPYAMIIGRPLEARAAGDGVWVKAQILSLEDPQSDCVAMADYFWDTLRAQPSIPWYPSIHGLVLNEDEVVEEGGGPTREIRRLLWQSVAFTQTPVNPAVSPVSTVPLRTFAKAFEDGSLDDLLRGIPSTGDPFLAQGTDAGEIDVLGILWALASGLASPSDPFALTDERFPREHVSAVLSALVDL